MSKLLVAVSFYSSTFSSANLLCRQLFYIGYSNFFFHDKSVQKVLLITT